jgi:hypothetical protein
MTLPHGTALGWVTYNVSLGRNRGRSADLRDDIADARAHGDWAKVLRLHLVRVMCCVEMLPRCATVEVVRWARRLGRGGG